MSAWLLSFLLPFALRVIERVAVPLLEKQYPALIPIATAIIKALGGTPPGLELKLAGDHFNGLQSLASQTSK